jgi:hypothetical protein
MIASEQNPLEALHICRLGSMSGITFGLFYCSQLFMGFRRGAHDGETVQVFITMQQGYPKILKKKKEIQNVLKKEKERSKNEKAIKPLSLQILKKKEKKKNPISSENQRADDREARNRNVAHGSHGDADNWWTEMSSLTVRTVQVLLVSPSLQTLCSSKRPF